MPQITLHPGELRRTSIRCCLPRQLPPTFHGSAVRFSYTVIVTYRAEFASAATAADTSAVDTPEATPQSPPTALTGIMALEITDDIDPEQGHTSELARYREDVTTLGSQQTAAVSAAAAGLQQMHEAVRSTVDESPADAVGVGGYSGEVWFCCCALAV